MLSFFLPVLIFSAPALLAADGLFLAYLSKAFKFTCMDAETYLAIARALTKVLGANHNISAADVMFVNATIWTGESGQPWAQFMAVDGHGRILAIGHRNQTQVRISMSRSRDSRCAHFQRL